MLAPFISNTFLCTDRLLFRQNVQPTVGEGHCPKGKSLAPRETRSYGREIHIELAFGFRLRFGFGIGLGFRFRFRSRFKVRVRVRVRDRARVRI